MDNMTDTSVSDFTTELKLKGFKVYEIDSTESVVRNYNRKDFYKICLNTGKNIIHYADRSFETNGPVLFFGNPHIPYSWETVSSTYTGYACLFTEDFLKFGDRSESLAQSPLFKLGGTPILELNQEQQTFISTLFQKMITEEKTDYTFKDELIRNYVGLIIHEALKMQPLENYSNQKNASSRIANVFFELLERQFPIESTDHPLQLKTAQDFAKHLSIHVNYLNRSVKE
ncbi:MAG: AraC family transcriptional regulator, partial [Daejeonella sp.]|nr:AraC family transcriptional regulator [Daejeonella sp.]